MAATRLEGERGASTQVEQMLTLILQVQGEYTGLDHDCVQQEVRVPHISLKHGTYNFVVRLSLMSKAMAISFSVEFSSNF